MMGTFVGGFGRDLRFAVRRLAAAPLFTLFAILSLAVGVGVPTIAYSVLSGVFALSDNTIDSDRFVLLVSDQRNARSMPWEDFDDFSKSATTIESLSAAAAFNAAIVAPHRTDVAAVEAVTGHYFRATGLTAKLGRTIDPSDDEHAMPVAVISDDLWRRRFGGDRAVIGRTVRIGGGAFDIIGVATAPIGTVMNPTPNGTAAWIPLRAARSSGIEVVGTGTGPFGFTGGGTPIDRLRLNVLGRLRAGVTSDVASAEAARIAAALDLSRPLPPSDTRSARITHRQWDIRTLTELQAGRDLRLLYVLEALVLLVAVVACTNLSNLVLARGAVRQQDISIRRALGASQWRLVREQLAEHVLVAIAGAAGSWAVMRAMIAIATRDLDLFGMTIAVRPGINTQTLMVAGGSLLVSLIVFGLEPAIQLTRTGDVRGRLAEHAGGLSLPRARRHRMLLRWQVAVASAYFILAAIAVRFVFIELGHDPGVKMDGLAVAQIQLPAHDEGNGRARTFVSKLREQADATGELAIAIASGLPFGTATRSAQISTPEHPIVSNGSYQTGRLLAATPDIFGLLGVRIVTGRGFDARDDVSGRPVAVVSTAVARRLFGTTDVIGRDLLVHEQTGDQPVQHLTLIGVASDTDSSYLKDDKGLIIYAPLAQHASSAPTVVVARRRQSRTSTPIAALEGLMQRTDPDAAIVRIGAATELLTDAYPLLRYARNGSLLLGCLTLLLAMVGLYGIQSHAVTHRTREIGVRMSFGASAGQVLGMVMRDGYRPVLEGMAIGLLMGITGRGIIRVYLDGKLAVIDPWMLSMVPIPLILAAFCACYLPARRAARIDPNVALRHL